MANIRLIVKKSTRDVVVSRDFAGVQLENLQDKFVVTFSDEFVNGTATLEYKVGMNAYFSEMEKVGNIYTLDIEQVLISEEGVYPFQIRIQQDDKVFKTKIFNMQVYPSINAEDGTPDYFGWQQWVIDYVNDIDGAISVIRRNGVKLPIVDTEVNISVPTKTSDITNDSGFTTTSALQQAVAVKQDTLVSGTNIKTINGTSILGDGDLSVGGGGTMLYKHTIALTTNEGVIYLIFINNNDTLINTQSLFEHAFSYDKVKLEIMFVVNDTEYVSIICMQYNNDGTAQSFVGLNAGLPMTDITSMTQSYSDTITQL